MDPGDRAWAAANNVELIPTPTYASYLTGSRAPSAAIDEFFCKNSDFDWDAFGYALADHVRHRNSRWREGQRCVEVACGR